ncbi:MAG: transposase [Planctomycetaceae bacterium]|nr:transposase [Planctomycetaceae bacterium]
MKELKQQSSEIVLATELVGEFATIICQREQDRFENWLDRARAETAPHAIRGFAQSLQQYQQAVQAAITLEWRNGQVNRLKTLKRQMYGRTKFDLLRARLLHAA